MSAAGQLGLLPEFDRATDRRLDLDFWPTPAWLARAILRKTCTRWPYAYAGCTYLDAGAGLGCLGLELEKLLAESGHKAPKITAVELHPERCAALPERWERIQGDFFAWGEQQLPRWGSGRNAVLTHPGRTWNVVLTNPPQQIDDRHVWIEWVDLCLRLAGPDGSVLALGHDLLWTTRDRADWWDRHKPYFYRPSPRRPSFSGDGKTDGRVWSWWEWRRGGVGNALTFCELLEVEW